MIAKKDIPVLGERRRILLQADEFVCLRPHGELQKYISSYNITFPAKTMMPDGFTEMPCGCATLVIENDNRRLFVHLDGPTTKPCIVGNRANRLAMLITIEFYPAGLYALTGINQSELTDQRIPLEAVDRRLSKLMCEAVEHAESVGELAAGLDRLLLENLSVPYHPQLVPVLQGMIGCAGNMDVKRLSDDIHYSERQLNRILKQHVGLGAKAFSRLIRVNNAFRMLKKPDNSITLVSDQLGFYDLSHFIRDFKLVCGMTPQEFRKNMSDFYINTTKL